MVLKHVSGTWAPRWWVLLLLLSLLLVITAPRLWAAPPLQSAEAGGALFQEKCTACHTIGQGNRLGPDLKGITALRDRAWLTRFIATPDKVLAEGDPIATQLLRQFNVPMPNLGLTEAQVAAIITYLETQTSGTPAPQATQPPAPALSQGDPITGKDLFTGVTGFRNGGPSCRACHSIASMGALGGGALGPDLTQAYTKLGDAGTASVLATLPFPIMSPLYGQRPLTPEEQANLKAFLQQASVQERPAEALVPLALLGIGGLLLLLLLAQLLWRRRLTGVRQPLVARRP